MANIAIWLPNKIYVRIITIWILDNSSNQMSTVHSSTKNRVCPVLKWSKSEIAWFLLGFRMAMAAILFSPFKNRTQIFVLKMAISIPDSSVLGWRMY